jgi:hypothetical protein
MFLDTDSLKESGYVMMLKTLHMLYHEVAAGLSEIVLSP